MYITAMTGLKAYWEALKGLRTDQQMRLPAIEWMVDETDDPRIRRSGRTSVLAAAFIRAACSAPGRKIRVFDHVPGNENARLILEMIDGIIDKSQTRRWFRLGRSSMSFEAEQGWNFMDKSGAIPAIVRNPTRDAKVEQVGTFSIEDVLQDVRNTAQAALELGASPDQVMKAVQDVIVRDVMEE